MSRTSSTETLAKQTLAPKRKTGNKPNLRNFGEKKRVRKTIFKDLLKHAQKILATHLGKIEILAEVLLNWSGMQIFKKPGILICSSAFLFALGTYLATMEVPVRITYDPAAAEQYDLMRAYLPFGFALWILALVFLVCGIVLGVRKPLAVAQLKKPFSMVSIIVGLTLGFLALTSTFLPWVIAERTVPFIETRGGTFNVGQYHALTGVNLMTGTNNIAGDIILLVFVGAIIGILHIPLLTLLERERTDAMRAFLFLLGGICIIGPVALVYAHRIWWINLRVDGALGFSVTFESPGLGFLIAMSCAIGLIAFGIFNTVKLAHRAHFNLKFLRVFLLPL